MPGRIADGDAGGHCMDGHCIERAMQKSIAAAEANRSFSRILRDVQAGDSFVVTAHGKPVARIVPVEDVSEQRLAAHAELMRHIRSQEAQNLPKWTRDELYDE